MKNMSSLITKNQPLASLTTFKIGGVADFFVIPKTKNDLLDALEWADKNNEQIFFLGGGSNLVISDEGIDGLVICSESLNKINLRYNDENFFLECEAGCTFEQIKLFCEKKSLSGFENFSGLPGTVGGAVYMNARCYEKSISELVHSVQYLDASKKTQTYKFMQSDWDYKKSPFQNTNHVILSAIFNVHVSNIMTIMQKNSEFITDRKKKRQFDFPSAGSVFKNNRDFGCPSGKLIDQAGLRGHQIGGAQIAPWHGNFIINKENATANDVKNLVDFAIESVYKQFGFTLETEILFVGK
ncbi:MAG: UDP-N-acetylmuramate dehydrogenase [Treponemataceae bacterium]